MIADVDHFKKNYEQMKQDNRAAVDELSRRLLRTVANEVRMSFKKVICIIESRCERNRIALEE